MDKGKLDAALQAAIATKEGADKIFFQLTRQVWQIDWTVAPYDIWGHYVDYDIPYFLRFMRADVGDEAEEKAILIAWIESRLNLKSKSSESGFHNHLISLIDELNQVRVSVRQG